MCVRSQTGGASGSSGGSNGADGGVSCSGVGNEVATELEHVSESIRASTLLPR